MSISDEAVEAAAKAHQALCFSEPWESLSDYLRGERLKEAEQILEAAAPHMLAGAWDAGYKAGSEDEADAHLGRIPGRPRNPYRP